MESRIRTLLAAMLALGALALPKESRGQEKNRQHRHYKLIDIGTLGGPQNYLPDNGGLSAMKILNNQGVLIGGADTLLPDPFLPNFCFNSDCFVSHAFQREEDCELTDLGALPGGGSSAALWMSRSRLVAGVSENGQTDPLLSGAPELRAVLWHDGDITDLGTLEGGYESVANAVNSKGQVVGLFTNTTPDPDSMFGSGYQTRAFFWQNGVMQDLGTLDTGADAQATLINNRGQVVGVSYTSSSPSAGCENLGLTLTTDPFIWEEGKGMRDLGNFGGTCTVAFDLNDLGQIVGTSNLAGDIIARAFLWSKGRLYDLGGSLGGTSTTAFALNERGEAVGTATLAGDILSHAVLWRGIGKLTDLGVIGNDECSGATSINAKSQVVGVSFTGCSPTSGSGFRAFLWEDGSIFDLNALIPLGSPLVLQFPLTINDHGEIAGTGVDTNGTEHPFLAIPCDEEHPNLEGCDYGLVDTDALAQTRPAQPVPIPRQLSASDMKGRTRAPLMNRNRRFGLRPPR
jgi:probable HAF family extracellular repeat protein